MLDSLPGIEQDNAMMLRLSEKTFTAVHELCIDFASKIQGYKANMKISKGNYNGRMIDKEEGDIETVPFAISEKSRIIYDIDELSIVHIALQPVLLALEKEASVENFPLLKGALDSLHRLLSTGLVSSKSRLVIILRFKAIIDALVHSNFLYILVSKMIAVISILLKFNSAKFNDDISLLSDLIKLSFSLVHTLSRNPIVSTIIVNIKSLYFNLMQPVLAAVRNAVDVDPKSNINSYLAMLMLNFLSEFLTKTTSFSFMEQTSAGGSNEEFIEKPAALSLLENVIDEYFCELEELYPEGEFCSLQYMVISRTITGKLVPNELVAVYSLLINFTTHYFNTEYLRDIQNILSFILKGLTNWDTVSIETPPISKVVKSTGWHTVVTSLCLINIFELCPRVRQNMLVGSNLTLSEAFAVQLVHVRDMIKAQSDISEMMDCDNFKRLFTLFDGYAVRGQVEFVEPTDYEIACIFNVCYLKIIFILQGNSVSSDTGLINFLAVNFWKVLEEISDSDDIGLSVCEKILLYDSKKQNIIKIIDLCNFIKPRWFNVFTNYSLIMDTTVDLKLNQKYLAYVSSSKVNMLLKCLFEMILKTIPDTMQYEWRQVVDCLYNINLLCRIMEHIEFRFWDRAAQLKQEIKDDNKSSFNGVDFVSSSFKRSRLMMFLNLFREKMKYMLKQSKNWRDNEFTMLFKEVSERIMKLTYIRRGSNDAVSNPNIDTVLYLRYCASNDSLVEIESWFFHLAGFNLFRHNVWRDLFLAVFHKALSSTRAIKRSMLLQRFLLLTIAQAKEEDSVSLILDSVHVIPSRISLYLQSVENSDSLLLVVDLMAVQCKFFEQVSSDTVVACLESSFVEQILQVLSLIRRSNDVTESDLIQFWLVLNRLSELLCNVQVFKKATKSSKFKAQENILKFGAMFCYALHSKERTTSAQLNFSLSTITRLSRISTIEHEIDFDVRSLLTPLIQDIGALCKQARDIADVLDSAWALVCTLLVEISNESGIGAQELSNYIRLIKWFVVSNNSSASNEETLYMVVSRSIKVLFEIVFAVSPLQYSIELEEYASLLFEVFLKCNSDKLKISSIKALFSIISKVYEASSINMCHKAWFTVPDKCFTAFSLSYRRWSVSPTSSIIRIFISCFQSIFTLISGLETDFYLKHLIVSFVNFLSLLANEENRDFITLAEQGWLSAFSALQELIHYADEKSVLLRAMDNIQNIELSLKFKETLLMSRQAYAAQ